MDHIISALSNTSFINVNNWTTINQSTKTDKPVNRSCYDESYAKLSTCIGANPTNHIWLVYLIYLKLFYCRAWNGGDRSWSAHKTKKGNG